GCMGVPQRGECHITAMGESAVVCDLASNSLRSVNCTAQGKHCVIDSSRGATCQDLNGGGGSGGTGGMGGRGGAGGTGGPGGGGRVGRVRRRGGLGRLGRL